MKKGIVVLTGAGISAESGLKTFRAADGLWEEERIEDVATPEGFARNPARVLDFYNQRRRKLITVAPNAAHLALAEFESQNGQDFLLVTQNIDDLHERAGSGDVVHMHGELLKMKCLHCGGNFTVVNDMHPTDPVKIAPYAAGYARTLYGLAKCRCIWSASKRHWPPVGCWFPSALRGMFIQPPDSRGRRKWRGRNAWN